MPVPRLVDRDAINPGAQARVASKAMNGPEDAEEDVLGEIERLVALAEQVDRELHDHALMLSNKLGARQFVASCTPLHKRRLSAADFRPTRDARLFHREFHYTKVRPRPNPKVPAGW